MAYEYPPEKNPGEAINRADTFQQMIQVGMAWCMSHKKGTLSYDETGPKNAKARALDAVLTETAPNCACCNSLNLVAAVRAHIMLILLLGWNEYLAALPVIPVSKPILIHNS